MYPGSSSDLARLARSAYLHVIHQGLDDLVQACLDGGKTLAGEYVEPALYQKRRDLVLDFPRHERRWRDALVRHVDDARQQLAKGQVPSTRPAGLDSPVGQFSLVEDSVIELDMAVSRLAQAIADKGGWQYTDLCTRLATLQADPLPSMERGAKSASDSEVVRPGVLARWVVDAWMSADLGLERWKVWQSVAHDEVSMLAEQAYHEANRLLLARGVRPEIDLRPFVRRVRGTPSTKPGALLDQRTAESAALASAVLGTLQPSAGVVSRLPAAAPQANGFDETRLMTRAMGLTANLVQKQTAVLNRLTQWVAKYVPDFAATQPQHLAGQPAPAGSELNVNQLGQAMVAAQQAVQAFAQTQVGSGPAAGPDPKALVQDLQQRKAELKKAAETPAQRATIEIVALLFQSLLTQERLPAQVRVWFARLQIPVLRVAVSEPDFFATIDHPARVLIDRMGSCVMGFEGNPEAFEQDALHKEIRRIVQVIEAYPETGRVVFQTVLTEFEKFLETYFRESNTATRKGVSLAQQLEQREAYAIQYTIELRKMLQDVPVHDAIREFLYKVWADVMGQSAVQTSPTSEPTRGMQRMARDLIWSASAKSSRDERREVLVRLPPLLKSLRAGMGSIGLSVEKQDEHIKALNAALSAAFSAKSAALSNEHLHSITQKLQALDAVLPEMDDVELDADMFRDLSGYENGDMEVVGEGGSMPTPAMLAWARELQLGAWFVLDYRGRQERVQFAWQGMQRHLMLFVNGQGRGVLFQVHRLAAFLQAGLLVPQEEESLTVQATRSALEKLHADPERLLH